MGEPHSDQLPSNPELRTAAEAFVRSGAASKNQGDVFQALIGATLIFPSESQGPGKIALALIRDPNGDLLTPAFTDARALVTWAPSGHTVATASASGFIPTILASPSAGLVLNPGSEGSLVLDRKILEDLAGRFKRPR